MRKLKRDVQLQTCQHVVIGMIIIQCCCRNPSRAPRTKLTAERDMGLGSGSCMAAQGITCVLLLMVTDVHLTAVLDCADPHSKAILERVPITTVAQHRCSQCYTSLSGRWAQE